MKLFFFWDLRRGLDSLNSDTDGFLILEFLTFGIIYNNTNIRKTFIHVNGICRYF